MSRLTLAAPLLGEESHVDEAGSVVCGAVRIVRFGAAGDWSVGLMPAKLTQEFVDAWLAEHRPDFVTKPGWVYVNNKTPIPGSCRVCGADCSPMLHHMKSEDKGHCRVCPANNRATDAVVKAMDGPEGHWIVGFEFRETNGSKNQTWVNFQCDCGHVDWVRLKNWVSQGDRHCGKNGFDTGKRADLYLLTRNKRGLQETQYGVSNVLDQRLARHEAKGWRLVDVISGPGDEILALENLIKDAMKAEGIYRREYHDEKYDGYTEAWDASDGLRPFMSLELLLSWAARADSREWVLV